MKAYLAIKYHPDHSNRARIEGLTAALARHGVETLCVTRDLEKWGQVEFSPEVLMRKSFAAIETCDLLLVDLTEKGVGLGIEAGYAHAKRIPILTIAARGADISETLRGISAAVCIYDSYKDAGEFVSRHMR